MLLSDLSNKKMTKSAVLKINIIENKYIIHPNLIVKDSGSYAMPPYIIEHDLNPMQLIDIILYALEISKEGSKPTVEDPKVRTKEYLKGMGFKTMKALYNNTINLSFYVRDGIITFTPWENKGSNDGFSGFQEDLTIKLPFNSPKEELAKALELTISRCK